MQRIPKDGGSRTDLLAEHQLDCHKKSTGFKDVYGRKSWRQLAPTTTGGCINPSKGRFTLRWSRFIGQVEGRNKVYSGV